MKDRKIVDVDTLGPGAVQVVAWVTVERAVEVEKIVVVSWMVEVARDTCTVV